MRRIVTGLKLEDEITVIYNKVNTRMFLRDFLDFISENSTNTLSNLVHGNTDGQVLRWDEPTKTWQVVSDLIISDTGNIGLGTLTPNYKLHIDNGDVFLATGSIGINEAPSPVHFLRISTNDILSPTVNARVDLSYQTKTGTFQGLHIMSNTPKSGSNSLAYGLNVTLQGSVTSGTHTYIAGRFKAVGATTNYAIQVKPYEGQILLNANDSFDGNTHVTIGTKSGATGGRPLAIIRYDNSYNIIEQNSWFVDNAIRIAYGRKNNIWEHLTLQEGNIRLDGTSFEFSKFTKNGFDLYTTFPQLSKDTQVGKIAVSMGRGSSKYQTTIPEARAFAFVHYNTDTTSYILGREYMAFYTGGQWDTTLDRPVQNTGLSAMMLRGGKVGIGEQLLPAYQLDVKARTGVNAFRVDTANITNFVTIHDSSVYSRMVVGGLQVTPLPAVLTISDQNYPYTKMALHRNATGTYGSELEFFKGSTREAIIGSYNPLFIIGTKSNTFQIRNMNTGFNIPIIHVEINNGEVGIVSYNNNWGGTNSFSTETGFDIAGDTKIRRQWVSGLYTNIGDKASSYTLGLESAESIDNGSGGLLLIKNEFYLQNRLGALGVADTSLILSNKETNGSNTDLLKVSKDGNFELLQSGATGQAGLILTDEIDGIRKKIVIQSGAISVVPV